MSRKVISNAPLAVPFMNGNTNNRDWQFWAKTIDQNLKSLTLVSKDFNPASIAANSTSPQSVNVPGAGLGDIVFALKPTNTAGLILQNPCLVSAVDTITLFFGNITGAPIDPGNEGYTFLICKI